MTVQKPKPKQLQSHSQGQANRYDFQPTICISPDKYYGSCSNLYSGGAGFWSKHALNVNSGMGTLSLVYSTYPDRAVVFYTDFPWSYHLQCTILFFNLAAYFFLGRISAVDVDEIVPARQCCDYRFLLANDASFRPFEFVPHNSVSRSIQYGIDGCSLTCRLSNLITNLR